MRIYAIGDEVFWARFESYEYRLECPDCRGKKQLTVIMGDGSQVATECDLCKRGYLGALGTIAVHQYRPHVEPARITRVETKLVEGKFEETEYGLD